MKKVILCAVLVLVCVSSAFGGATEELLKAAKDSNTTPKMIENLIKFGADVNAENEDGNTALMTAATLNNDPEVMNVLINAGADVNAKAIYGTTALMCAAINNSNPEVVKALINAGADLFAKDNEGKTVLDYAHNDEIKRIIRNAAKKKGRL